MLLKWNLNHMHNVSLLLYSLPAIFIIFVFIYEFIYLISASHSSILIFRFFFLALFAPSHHRDKSFLSPFDLNHILLIPCICLRDYTQIVLTFANSMLFFITYIFLIGVTVIGSFFRRWIIDHECGVDWEGALHVPFLRRGGPLLRGFPWLVVQIRARALLFEGGGVALNFRYWIGWGKCLLRFRMGHVREVEFQDPFWFLNALCGLMGEEGCFWVALSRGIPLVYYKATGCYRCEYGIV